MSASRGRPRLIERDVAVLLAVEWYRQAERLTTDKAGHAVTGLWQSRGRAGLGRPDAPSKAVFRCMHLAKEQLGDGRFLVLPGVEAAEKLVGAACFFIPAKSTIRGAHNGLGQVIRGACWHWPFAAEKAELLYDGHEFVVGGDGRAGAPPRASLGQGPGRVGPVPEPVFP